MNTKEVDELHGIIAKNSLHKKLKQHQLLTKLLKRNRPAICAPKSTEEVKELCSNATNNNLSDLGANNNRSEQIKKIKIKLKLKLKNTLSALV